MQARCLIQEYDPAVKEAPFTFNTLAECWIEDTDNGEDLCNRMADATWAAGFRFKFYSMTSEPGYKYTIVVRD